MAIVPQIRSIVSIIALIVSLFGASVSFSADRVSVTITITNTPANGNTFVLNGSTRTWKPTATNAANQITIAGSVAANYTNLAAHVEAVPFAGPVVSTRIPSTGVRFTGQVGGAMVASITGTWGYLTLSTQNVTSPSIAVTVPYDSMSSLSARTNVAVGITEYINRYNPGGISAGANAAAINALSATGYVVMTAAGQATNRSIVATSSKIVVVNGNGQGGNTGVDAVPANFDINALGGSPLTVAKGGSGITNLYPITQGTNNGPIGFAGDYSGATNWVMVTPYDTIATTTGDYGGTGGAIVSKEFLTTRHTYRIRQTGDINKVRFYLDNKTTLSDFRVKIWRKDLVTGIYTLVDSTPNLVSLLTGASINSLNLATPLRGAREGDYVGYRLVWSAGNAVNNLVQSGLSGYGGTYSTIDTSPAGTGYAWESQTFDNGIGVPIELYEAAPIFVTFGDSIISGSGINYSFVDGNGEASNLPHTLADRIGAGTGFNFQNMGISGNNTVQLAARVATDVVAIHPKIAILQGGINDVRTDLTFAGFSNSWVTILSAVTNAGIKPVVILMYPFTSTSSQTHSTNGTVAEMRVRDNWNGALTALASNVNAVVVDPNPYVGAARASGDPGNLWDYQGNMSYDGLHPSTLGQIQIARAVLDALTSITIRGDLTAGNATLGNRLSFNSSAGEKNIIVDRQSGLTMRGNDLRIQSGGSGPGSTNKSGGDLYISGGVGTGNGASGTVYFDMGQAQSSGQLDHTNYTTRFVVSPLGIGVGTGTTIAGEMVVNGVAIGMYGNNIIYNGLVNSSIAYSLGGAVAGVNGIYGAGGIRFYSSLATYGSQTEAGRVDAGNQAWSLGTTKKTARLNLGGFSGSTGDEWLRMEYLSSPDAYNLQWRQVVGASAVGYLLRTTNNSIAYDNLFLQNESFGIRVSTAAGIKANATLNGSVSTGIRTATLDFSFSDTDQCVFINGAGKTGTLPTAVGIEGRYYTAKLIAASTTATIATTSSQTIDGSTTYSLSARYQTVTVKSDGANWQVVDVVGDASRQPLDADLTAIAGLAGAAGDIIQHDGTAWRLLPKGAANTLLKSGAATNDWAAQSSITLSNFAGVLPLGKLELSGDSSKFVRADGTEAVPSGGGTNSPTFANPTATVGTSAVNGSSTNSMRADAAPAINQAMSPTWSALHNFLNSTTNQMRIGWDPTQHIWIYGNSSGELNILPTGGKVNITGNLKVTGLGSALPLVSDGVGNISAAAIDLGTGSAVGTVAAARMPAFSGDMSNTAGSLVTALAATGTAGTYSRVTTDSKGRVTSGAELVVANLPAGTLFVKKSVLIDARATSTNSIFEAASDFLCTGVDVKINTVSGSSALSHNFTWTLGTDAGGDVIFPAHEFFIDDSYNGQDSFESFNPTPGAEKKKIAISGKIITFCITSASIQTSGITVYVRGYYLP